MSNPYGTSPSRRRVPRQLPSLATNLGSSTSQYQMELLAHVSPGSVSPLPDISPIKDERRDGHRGEADGHSSPAPEYIEPRSEAEVRGIDMGADDETGGGGLHDEVNQPQDWQSEEQPEQPCFEPNVEKSSTLEVLTEPTPVATADPELVAAIDAEVQATAKAMAAIQSTVGTVADALKEELEAELEATSHAVAALKAKAMWSDGVMSEVIDAEVSATTIAVGAIQSAVQNAEAREGATGVLGGANVGELQRDPSDPFDFSCQSPIEADPELVRAMDLELAATTQAVVAIQAAANAICDD
eukprot:scaffold24086_cov26-Tisochrysis_lutea.AAC.2